MNTTFILSGILCVFFNNNYFIYFSLLGVDKLFSYAISEWLNDIKKNQLPGILGGVGPMHSLVQLGKLNLISVQAHSDFFFNSSFHCFVFVFLKQQQQNTSNLFLFPLNAS